VLVDSHIHLDHHAFDADRDEVVARADAAGVRQLVIPAVDQASWRRIHALCTQAADRCFAGYGIHPLFVAAGPDAAVEALAAWCATHPSVAIGEIGLDFHAATPDAKLQRAWFAAQLALARERGLPVIVHARQALEEVILALRGYPGVRGVVHSFSGSEEQAKHLWRLGFHLGIGGVVTYPRAQRLRRIVAHMPIEFLLLESDAPDQPGASHRGGRNEPAYLAEVLQVVAELRGEPATAIAAAASANARRLFALPLGAP
jgi:TatD DNase family protein